MAPGFTFVVNELLNPTNEECLSLFAKFLYEYNHFIELGAKCYTEMQMIDKALTITYFIPVSSFSVITYQINKLLDFKQNTDLQTDFSIDSFKRDFKNDFSTNFCVIEDEVKFYSKRI